MARIDGPDSLGFLQLDHGVRPEWTSRVMDHRGRTATAGIAGRRGRPDGRASAVLRLPLHRDHGPAAAAGPLPPHPLVTEHGTGCGLAVSLCACLEAGVRALVRGDVAHRGHPTELNGLLHTGVTSQES
jgi:hypothetical protein